MYFLKFLLILIIAVSAAVFIHNTPALLLIELGDYTFAGPLWLIVLLLLVSFLVLRVIFRFCAWVINAPRGVFSFIFGSKTAKIDRNLQEFLMANIMDHPLQERKNLVALSRLKFYPGLCAAKAALIAIQEERPLDYLDSLEDMKADLELSPWIMSLVELHEALSRASTPEQEVKIETLLSILKKEPEAQSAVWPLETLHAREIQDFNRLREAATQLKSFKLIDSGSYLKLLTECDLGQLEQASTLVELRNFWNDLARNKRKNPLFIAEFVKKLAAFGENNEAIAELELGLSYIWSDELFALYGSILSDHKAQQLQQAEKWSRHMPNNASNYLVLAKLYEANLVLMKAEQYYEQSLQYEKSKAAYCGLAEVMIAKGQSQQAIQYYKKAAQML